MKKIAGIGFVIPSDDDDFISLDSISSLSEIDIAVFSPDFSQTSYSNYSANNYPSNLEYEGKTLYNKESSANILQHMKHWQNELMHFVENGGTLFINLCEKKDFFVYTGTKDISGTGRNQKTTNHVSPLSNYDFISSFNVTFQASTGKTIVPSLPIFNSFYGDLSDYMDYKTHIKSLSDNKATFITKNKDRALGVNLEIKNGFALIIPNLNLDLDEFSVYDTTEDQNYYTTEGKRIGKVFKKHIVEIDNALKSTSLKSPKPNWLSKQTYLLKNSEETLTLIKENQKEIDKKNLENIRLESILQEQESLKDLLFETGIPLEDAVIKSLTILGYKAEHYDDGVLELDQIIISPEGDRLIGECEGKENKDIDVTKFRQLLDSLNADFEKEEVLVKAHGLLIGNPQRLIEPIHRTLSFTAKCQSGAKRENIGLIKTSDLFDICKYLTETKDEKYAKDCRLAIKKNLGKIIVFPKIPHS